MIVYICTRFVKILRLFKEISLFILETVVYSLGLIFIYILDATLPTKTLFQIQLQLTLCHLIIKYASLCINI